MTSEHIRYRSDLLGTQVITRDGGRRLGVVSQLWVDVDRKEVIALGLRQSMLSGVLSNTQEIMLLSNIRQIGDVILVDDDMVLEDPITVEPYSKLISCEVITETGEFLGKVRGFKFDVITGELQSLIIANVGLPQIPDQVVSTYELPIEEVVSSGPDRLIVFEGAEEKLVQLTVGILERLGITAPPWEREDGDDYMMPTPPSNQLGTGLRTPAPPVRAAVPVAEETWSEDDWSEPAPRWEPQPLQQRQVEPAYAEPDYYDGEQDNWGDDSNWETERAAPIAYEAEAADYASDYQEVTEDVWTEDEPKPYNPPPVNLPEKKKAYEYEEEADY